METHKRVHWWLGGVFRRKNQLNEEEVLKALHYTKLTTETSETTTSALDLSVQKENSSLNLQTDSRGEIQSAVYQPRPNRRFRNLRSNDKQSECLVSANVPSCGSEKHQQPTSPSCSPNPLTEQTQEDVCAQTVAETLLSDQAPDTKAIDFHEENRKLREQCDELRAKYDALQAKHSHSLKDLELLREEYSHKENAKDEQLTALEELIEFESERQSQITDEVKKLRKELRHARQYAHKTSARLKLLQEELQAKNQFVTALERHLDNLENWSESLQQEYYVAKAASELQGSTKLRRAASHASFSSPRARRESLLCSKHSKPRLTINRSLLGSSWDLTSDILSSARSSPLLPPNPLLQVTQLSSSEISPTSNPGLPSRPVSSRSAHEQLHVRTHTRRNSGTMSTRSIDALQEASRVPHELLQGMPCDLVEGENGEPVWKDQHSLPIWLPKAGASVL